MNQTKKAVAKIGLWKMNCRKKRRILPLANSVSLHEQQLK